MPVPGVTILATHPDSGKVLTPEAQNYLATLHRLFNNTRIALLKRRVERQREIDEGRFPSFLPETEAVRNSVSWKGPPLAPGLVDRRVEITGPVDRKMIINALNSGATQFMADFEDSTSPTWENLISGQVNLKDANNRAIDFTASNGKRYSLRKDGKIATLLVRPRGWHMEEAHFLVDGQPISASIFDFGLYFFHNAKKTLENGFGPYFYLPKMESHLEARLWNDIFNVSQDILGIPRGTIRATVLIETILAAFEMEEIIYELKEHSSGLNCGRWDYIFSFIKKFRNHSKFLLPDRSEVGMTSGFMDAYVKLLIKTCHKRGVHAMGGMAAQIPIKNNEKANQEAMEKVKRDKTREALAGHDGTWVAHPDLVIIAKSVFDKVMPQPNQIFIRRDEVNIQSQDLLNPSVNGSITEQGIRSNVSVGIQYMEAWLKGQGCVPIHNLMEDAATAEISRSQLWQWVKHKAKTSDGKVITTTYLDNIIQDELRKIKESVGEQAFKAGKYALASKLFASTTQGKDYAEFLTTLCYQHIVNKNSSKL